MGKDEGNEVPTSQTGGSRSTKQRLCEDVKGSLSGVEAHQHGSRKDSKAPWPHELIPPHIRDKEKIEVRRNFMKTAAKELGSLRQTLHGDALSQEVLCAKFMKRKALYCCTSDPDKPDRRPVRPLDILCEAKVSAASPTFIKCSCEACTGGTSGYTGGSFHSIGEFLQHGKKVFGRNTIIVMAETELSWPELLDLLRLDPTDHVWYCLFCEEDLPGAPLRMCDACQLACHGACYTRAYGQPLGTCPDGRVLCISCKDPSLQTLQEIQAPKPTSSKAGTARYTVPLMPNEVFRRETNPSHFEKGTYDFWGPKQARLMDALVFPMDSPQAQAGTAAAAAVGFGTAEADGTAATAAAGDKQEQDDKQEQHNESEAKQEQQQQQEERKKATHVLIVRDPSGQILTIDYEFGKHHKTHGENRKLWVVPLLEHLGMQLGDLLIATKDPFSTWQQQQQKGKHQQQLHKAPVEPSKALLDKCDKVLQLHIIRKGQTTPQTAVETATARAQAALKAAAAKAEAAAAARAAADAPAVQPPAAAAATNHAAAAVDGGSSKGTSSSGQQEQLRSQQQLLQRKKQEQVGAARRGAGFDVDMSDDGESEAEKDSEAADDDDYEAPARGRGRGRGSRGGRTGRGRGRGAAAAACIEGDAAAEGQQKPKRKRRTKAEMLAAAEQAAAATVATAEASEGDQQNKRQRLQGSAAADAAADIANAQQVQHLQQQLADAQQHIATLQRQLDTAAQQRATLEKARFEAIKQRDEAFAERDKSHAQFTALQKEQQEMKQLLQQLQGEAQSSDEKAGLQQTDIAAAQQTEP